METTFRFLHVLCAIGMGVYLFLPFLMLRISKLSQQAQVGYVGSLFTLNRIGQYLLIVQFITGGYMISKGSYSVAWDIVVIVVFLIIAALAGMMARPMKRLIDKSKKGIDSNADLQRIKLFSVIIGISFLLIIILMFFPYDII